MQTRRDQRWLWVTLAVSLGLHVLVFLLIREPAAPVPTRPRAIEMDVRWIEAAPAPVAPKTPVVSHTRATPAARPQQAGKATEEPTPTTAQTSRGGATGETAARGDVPLARGKLVPDSLGIVLKMPEAADAEPPHGVTLHNEVMDQPDAVAVREYTGEVLSRKLNQDLATEIAAAANAVGTVPPFFRRAESSMKDRVASDPPKHSELANSYVAREVGKTALTPGVSAEAAKKVTDSPLGYSVMNHTVPVTNIGDQAFRESALQMLSISEAVQERAHAVRLRTVLELTTDATGGVADVSILEKSGDTTFDESALHLSRRVLRELPESDEKGLGTSWWKSRWQFTWEPPVVRVRLLEARPLTR